MHATARTLQQMIGCKPMSGDGQTHERQSANAHVPVNPFRYQITLKDPNTVDTAVTAALDTTAAFSSAAADALASWRHRATWLHTTCATLA